MLTAAEVLNPLKQKLGIFWCNLGNPSTDMQNGCLKSIIWNGR